MIRFNVSLSTSGKGYESYSPGEFEEVTKEEAGRLFSAMVDEEKPFVRLDPGEVVAPANRVVPEGFWVQPCDHKISPYNEYGCRRCENKGFTVVRSTDTPSEAKDEIRGKR